MRSKGKVYLVGAGPGDAGLLTVKAENLIQRADVIICDRLVGPDVMKLFPPNAEVFFMGKGRRFGFTQTQISELLVRKAREGKCVVRLKGGDPFLFGRGAEEAAALRRASVDFEVVPGVSSVFAVPELVLIPLTHRDISSVVAIVTGEEGGHKKEAHVDWKKLAGFDGTLVVLMGVKRLEGIVRELLKYGKSPSTPAAIIERGSLPGQKIIIDRLDRIARRSKAENVEPPALLVVGRVINLGKNLGGPR